MSPAEVRMALDTLPKGGDALPVVYNQAMQRIEAQKPGMSRLAQKAMSWITYAERLLTAVELQCALAVQHGTSDFDEENLYDVDDIVSACGGLVIVDEGQQTDTVRLVHYSTQEFLRQAGDRYFPNAQQNIATSCLTYLLYDTFQEDLQCDSTSDPNIKLEKKVYHVRDTRKQYPLLLYAIEHWETHASECSEQSIKDLTRILADVCRVPVFVLTRFRYVMCRMLELFLSQNLLRDVFVRRTMIDTRTKPRAPFFPFSRLASRLLEGSSRGFSKGLETPSPPSEVSP